jgi:hypothetical protein
MEATGMGGPGLRKRAGRTLEAGTDNVASVPGTPRSGVRLAFLLKLCHLGIRVQILENHGENFAQAHQGENAQSAHVLFSLENQAL